jgi:hypothetical protein
MFVQLLQLHLDVSSSKALNLVKPLHLTTLQVVLLSLPCSLLNMKGDHACVDLSGNFNCSGGL